MLSDVKMEIGDNRVAQIVMPGLISYLSCEMATVDNFEDLDIKEDGEAAELVEKFFSERDKKRCYQVLLDLNSVLVPNSQLGEEDQYADEEIKQRLYSSENTGIVMREDIDEQLARKQREAYSVMKKLTNTLSPCRFNALTDLMEDVLDQHLAKSSRLGVPREERLRTALDLRRLWRLPDWRKFFFQIHRITREHTNKAIPAIGKYLNANDGFLSYDVSRSFLLAVCK